MRLSVLLCFLMFYLVTTQMQSQPSLYLPENSIGSSDQRNPNINSSGGDANQDYKRSVCQIYFPSQNGKLEIGTGVLVNTVKNTYSLGARKIYIITDDHFIPDGLDEMYVSFNYELPQTQERENNDKYISKVYKVSFIKRMSNAMANLALLELEVNNEDIFNPTSPLYNAYAIGWKLRYTHRDSFLDATIHHPSADAKKISMGIPYRMILTNQGITSEGDYSTQTNFYFDLNSNTYFPDMGSRGAPLIDLKDGTLIAIKKPLYVSIFSALENSWFKNDENEPGFINFLDPDKAWISSMNGGYLKDLIQTPENEDFSLYLDPLGMPFHANMNLKTPEALFAEVVSFSRIRRESILGSGIKAKNLNGRVYLVFSSNNHLFYAVKLDSYNNTAKEFQGNALNPNLNFDGSILQNYRNSLSTGFNSSNFKQNYLHYLVRSARNNPNFVGLRNQAQELTRMDVKLILDNDDLSFSTNEITAIKLPFDMPFNAIELFQPEELQNFWKSKKYSNSTGEISEDLFINKLTLQQEDGVNKSITTGDNGGYLNLVNPNYYFETVKTSYSNQEPNKLKVQVDVAKRYGIPYKCKVWMDFFPTVDLNNNYTFENLEDFGVIEYLDGTINPNISPFFKFSFEVPDNIILGMQPGEERYFRMRVAVCDAEEEMSQNGIYIDGDVEDYLVKFQAPTLLETLASLATLYIPIRTGNQLGINNNPCGVPFQATATSTTNTPVNVGDATYPYSCNSYVCASTDCQINAVNSSITVEGDYSVCINGTNDYIALDQGGSLLKDAFNTRTVSFWLNNTNNTGIEEVYDEGGITEGGMGVQINNSTNKIEVGVRSGTSLQTISATTATTDWIHVVAIFDNGTLSLYQNGTLSAQNTAIGFNTIPAHNDEAGFGGTNGTNVFGGLSSSYYGCADEIMIFDDALTPSQVDILYGSGVIDTGNFRKTETKQTIETTQKLMIYPNPSKGDVNLITEVKKAGTIKIQILDPIGKIVYQKTINDLDVGFHHIALKEILIPAATYIVKVINNQYVQTAKLIIEK